MNSFLLDSSFLVALLDSKDTWHSVAVEIEGALPARVTRVFLDVVIAETLSVLARRFEERKRSDASH